METLLVVAIVVTALAVVVQAGALIAMYVMSRRVMNNVNALVTESQKLMAPLERVTANFESVSQDFVAMGKDARQEQQRVETMLHEIQTAVRDEIQGLRGRLNETVDEVHDTVMT